MYFVADLREEGANAEAEGELWLGGEAKCEDAPRCSVGDDLVLAVLLLVALSRLPILCLHFTNTTQLTCPPNIHCNLTTTDRTKT